MFLGNLGFWINQQQGSVSVVDYDNAINFVFETAVFTAPFPIAAHSFASLLYNCWILEFWIDILTSSHIAAMAGCLSS